MDFILELQSVRSGLERFLYNKDTRVPTSQIAATLKIRYAMPEIRAISEIRGHKKRPNHEKKP
ncbi:MAG: hypothetical protein JWN15_81, partial [Firmicutes bacterium]|nr:hypothetical protein [Bacillota bacterium]